jgi:hypothetical protein
VLNKFIVALMVMLSFTVAVQGKDLNDYRLFIDSTFTFVSDNKIVKQFTLNNGIRGYATAVDEYGIHQLNPGSEVFFAPALIRKPSESLYMTSEDANGKIVEDYAMVLDNTLLEVVSVKDLQWWWINSKYVVHLSDGSEWEVTEKTEGNLTRKWQKGDRILISPVANSDYAEWYAINVSRYEFVNITNPELLKNGYKKNTAIHSAYLVRPYVPEIE